MSRLILTFPTLFQVLAADKLLRDRVKCRPTPTPQCLSSDICGLSMELLDRSQRDTALEILRSHSLPPKGEHEIL